MEDSKLVARRAWNWRKRVSEGIRNSCVVVRGELLVLSSILRMDWLVVRVSVGRVWRPRVCLLMDSIDLREVDEDDVIGCDGLEQDFLAGC